MTLAYIIFAIVILHIVIGFAWVIWKLSKKSNNIKGKDGDR